MNPRGGRGGGSSPQRGGSGGRGGGAWSREMSSRRSERSALSTSGSRTRKHKKKGSGKTREEVVAAKVRAVGAFAAAGVRASPPPPAVDPRAEAVAAAVAARRAQSAATVVPPPPAPPTAPPTPAARPSTPPPPAALAQPAQTLRIVPPRHSHAASPRDAQPSLASMGATNSTFDATAGGSERDVDVVEEGGGAIVSDFSDSSLVDSTVEEASASAAPVVTEPTVEAKEDLSPRSRVGPSEEMVEKKDPPSPRRLPTALSTTAAPPQHAAPHGSVVGSGSGRPSPAPENPVEEQPASDVEPPSAPVATEETADEKERSAVLPRREAERSPDVPSAAGEPPVATEGTVEEKESPTAIPTVTGDEYPSSPRWGEAERSPAGPVGARRDPQRERYAAAAVTEKGGSGLESSVEDVTADAVLPAAADGEQRTLAPVLDELPRRSREREPRPEPVGSAPPSLDDDSMAVDAASISSGGSPAEADVDDRWDEEMGAVDPTGARDEVPKESSPLLASERGAGGHDSPEKPAGRTADEELIMAYAQAGLMERVFSLQLVSLLASMLLLVPLVLLFLGDGSRLCPLIGRTKYQLLVALLPVTATLAGNRVLQSNYSAKEDLANSVYSRESFGGYFKSATTASLFSAGGMAFVVAIFSSSAGDAMYAAVLGFAALATVAAAAAVGTAAPLLFGMITGGGGAFDQYEESAVTIVQDTVGGYVMTAVAYLLFSLFPLTIDPGDMCVG